MEGVAHLEPLDAGCQILQRESRGMKKTALNTMSAEALDSEAWVVTRKGLHSSATAMSKLAASSPRSNLITPLNSEMTGLFLLFFLLRIDV